MKERPILFSYAMVRAIRSGLKTQTRRVVDPRSRSERTIFPFNPSEIVSLIAGMFSAFTDGRKARDFPCPYGQPGDRLWVREAFSGPHNLADMPPSKWPDTSPIYFWADGDPLHGDWTRPKPSIHMPRWACRLVLEIVSVRVERLQSISREDAIAEGIDSRASLAYPKERVWCDYAIPNDPFEWFRSPVDSFRSLWASINGAESWNSNPWVWVIEFKVVQP